MKPLPLKPIQHYCFQWKEYAVRSSSGVPIWIPQIDGWFQISAGFNQEPTRPSKAKLFQLIRRGILPILKDHPGTRFYLLFKPPGLKLRFYNSEECTALAQTLADLASTLTPASIPGLRSVELDSFLEQSQFFCGMDSEWTRELLQWSSLSRIQATARSGSIDAWASFTLQVLKGLLRDSWWVWETLRRFEHLRAQVVHGATEGKSARFLTSPETLTQELDTRLEKQQKLLRAGESTSLSALMFLNYLFNQWEVDGLQQAAIISTAQNKIRPKDLLPSPPNRA